MPGKEVENSPAQSGPVPGDPSRSKHFHEQRYLIVWLIAMTLGGVLALAISRFITFLRTKRDEHSSLDEVNLPDRRN